MAYSDKVLEHYNNPRNVGSFDQKDAAIGTGLVGAPECGDVLKLQIRVNPTTGRIEDARFKTFGDSLASPWIGPSRNPNASAARAAHAATSACTRDDRRDGVM